MLRYGRINSCGGNTKEASSGPQAGEIRDRLACRLHILNRDVRDAQAQHRRKCGHAVIRIGCHDRTTQPGGLLPAILHRFGADVTLDGTSFNELADCEEFDDRYCGTLTVRSDGAQMWPCGDPHRMP